MAESIGSWRQIHNEGFKLRALRLILLGNDTERWWGNLRKGDHCGDPGIDGRIILGWISGKWDVGMWTGWS
jgi:hypothetical protein